MQQLKKSKRKIDRIIVHCTATVEDHEITNATIDHWHRQKGYACIGYHYVIYLDGSIHDGRDADLAGAHAYGYNAHSIGVCYVGGLSADGKPKDTRTPAQKKALLALLRELVCLYPEAEIIGHRDVSIKACPCFDAKQEYRNI